MKKQKIVAIIGSRNTPDGMLKEIIKIGEWCRENHIFCRSGKAKGADKCAATGGQEMCIQYIPWASFNQDFISRAHDFVLPEQLTDYHHQLINKYHPAPDKLSRGAYRLIARNCYQVLGKDLNQPVNAVVCWCEESLDGWAIPTWKGGTGFACRLAHDSEIPILNMYREQFNTANKVIGYLKNILEI